MILFDPSISSIKERVKDITYVKQLHTLTISHSQLLMWRYICFMKREEKIRFVNWGLKSKVVPTLVSYLSWSFSQRAECEANPTPKEISNHQLTEVLKASRLSHAWLKTKGLNKSSLFLVSPTLLTRGLRELKSTQPPHSA